jgi:RNA polymerase sigma-70 factor (ECF subfamily)
MDLEAFLALAEETVPTVRVSRKGFGEWFARRADHAAILAAVADDEATRALAAELWLACAVSAGDATAIRLFEERYVAPLETTLTRMRLAPAELDEVKQLVRAKLLVVGESGRARIEEYAGQGRMSGLVQVVATREAISLLRRTKREVAGDEDDLTEPLAVPVDPGLEVLKGKYRVAFRAAFAEAVSALTPKQRNLLRMHLLGGVTLEQLASVQGVHRASIVRWLKEARETVSAKTKETLSRTLGVRADELSSLHALAESQLDASVERLLRTRVDADAEGEDERHQ